MKNQRKIHMLSLKNGIDKEMLYKFVNLSGLSIHSIQRGGNYG